MSILLEVNKIVKQYGDFVALNEVSLSVPKGSIYGLLGPNGAGKTSLIRIINQITLPDSGEIIVQKYESWGAMFVFGTNERLDQSRSQKTTRLLV
ncbi:MAG: hypothetical protein RL074_166 [Bacteroidota bacterium]